MKKMFMFLTLLALSLGLCLNSYAGDQITVDGFKVDGDGAVYFKTLIEVVTTSDTVTARESGKTFLVNATSGAPRFTLPTAATGLTYTFKAINGPARIELSPQATDTMVGCVVSAATSTFAAGDDLDSATTTGDSVTIVGASTKWYCIDRVSTWVDGN